MNNSSFMRGVLVGLAACLVIFQSAFAVGTPAGTRIDTRSRVIFTTASGAASDTAFSNTVSFFVLQVAAVNMTPSTNASATSADSVYVTYPLTVTNSGNGTDRFGLAAVSSQGWVVNFYADANGDQILQSGEVTAGAITQTSDINADSTYRFIVRVFVPRGGSLNGAVDSTTVTATSNFDNAKTATSRVTTTVNTVNFPGAASALTVTPTNPSPGQNVTYSYTLTNTGSVAATGVTFTDLINLSQFSFVSATTTAGTFDGGTPSTWTVGTVNPGSSVTVTMVLQVNAGLPNGTILNNTIDITYTVGGNTFTQTSNNPYGAVGVLRGVAMSPTSLSAAKEPEDTLVYAMTVKNTGNSNDVLELSYSSTKSFAWTLYHDVNGSGTLDGGDTPLADAAGTPTGVDVDTVAVNDSVKILARTVVPVGTGDGDNDVTTFTVKSAADASKFQSAIATNTINMAALTINRTVSPSGNQPPGQEMEFTISYQNSGHGKAYNVVIPESEPDSMSYVDNSVTIDNVAKTDIADSDEVTVTTVSGRKLITISLGTVNALSAEGTIKYRATIH